MLELKLTLFPFYFHQKPYKMQPLCVIKKRDSIPFTCSSLVIFSMCDLEQSQAAKLPGKAFLPERYG